MKRWESLALATFVIFAFLGNALAIEVKLGVGPPGVIGYMPLYIAQGLGYFKELEKEGISLKLVNFKGGSEAAIALLGGDIDLATITVTHAIKAKAEGKELKFLLTFFNSQVMAMVVQADLKEVRTPADLKGKRIGITSMGSATHMMGRHIIEKWGLRPEDVSFVPVGGATSIPAFKAKQIDALVMLDPVISRLLKEGVARMLVDARTVEGTRAIYGAEHISSGLLARPDYISKNPQVVEKVVAMFVKTLKWIKANPSEEILKAAPKGIKWDVEQIEGNRGGLSPDGLVIKAGVEKVIEYLKKDGLLPPTYTYPAEVIYDNSFVEKALKGL